MANLNAQPKWSSIRLLEAHELARGGLNGNMNEQAKALAERTEFLNQEKASKSEIAQGVFEFGTYAEFNAAKATLPQNCTVVIGEENTSGTGTWGIGNNRWNGISLTKSTYDPVLIAKKLDEEKINNFSKAVYKTKLLNDFINDGVVDAATMLLGVNSATQRSVLVQVKPNTAYKLIKNQSTDRFIVNLFNFWPYQASSSEVVRTYRTVKNSLDDGLTSGEVLFNTDSDTRYLHVYVSRLLAEEPEIELIELNGLEVNLEAGDNICDPYYFEPLSFTFPNDSQTIIFSRYATNKTHILDCTGIGPQLAITRVNSDRFRVVAMIVNPATKEKSFVRVGEYSTNAEVINLPANTKYLLTFFQAVQEGGKLQILNGQELTAYRDYFKALPNDVQLNAKAIASIKEDIATDVVDKTLSNLSETFDLDSNITQINSSQAINVSPSVDANGLYPDFNVLATARTYLIPVDPSTIYTIKKPEKTQHLIINEHSFFPIGRESGHFVKTALHAVRDGLATDGIFSIETDKNTNWISICVAVNTGIAADLTLTKKEYPGSMFKKSKNLINPKLKGFTSSIAYVDTLTNPFSGGPTYRSAVVSINPNQTYTLTKFGDSSRFRVVLINANVDASRSYTNVIKQDDAKTVTFTTDSNSLFVAIYYSNNSEDVNLQLEIGDQSTAYESYGFKLKASQSFGQSGFPLVVIDTNYDVTAQLKSAFAQSENAIVYLNPGHYEFNQTLNIPSNSRIIGLGDVTLKLQDTALLEKVIWRGTNVKTYLKSAESSVNAYLENIKVVGADTVDKSFLHFGICMQGQGHKLENVSTDHVNWEVSSETENGERRAGGNGWGLVFYRAKNGRVNGGRFTYGGYENIGTDNAEDIIFDGVYCGIGWRTSFQIHRASKNIKLINSTVEQERSSFQTHSAITIHGNGTNTVNGVLIDGNKIVSNVEESWANRGGIQSVEGREHDVTITNNDIVTNNWGICAGEGGADNVKDWVVANNRIYAKEVGVRLRGKNSTVHGNIIKAASHVEFYGAQATTCVEVNNVFIPLD